MEVVASCLVALVTEPARILCGFIYSKVSNAFKFQSNFNALKQKRDEINEALVRADKEGKLPTHQVGKWLTEVEGIEQEVNSLQENTNSVLCGCSLNCSSRCGLGTMVVEKLEEVNRLMNDSSFPANMVKENHRVKIESDFNALEQKMNILIEWRNQINEELVTADKEGKVPTYQVKNWLTDVGNRLTEVEKIKLEVNSMQANTDTVLCGCSLNCSSRCRLGTTVAEKLEEVNRLINDSSFPAGMVEANRRVKSVEYIPGPSIQTQTTASANLDKIMNLLNDDAVRRIGIWGMGGVGKTTLVKNLNNNLQSGFLKQLFDIVIWVTVSKDFNLERVQTQIAERLNLTLESQESEKRAIKLYQRLEKEKKFLLILDDVWDTFDLDSLGVPQPENHTGSNIILTSRSLEVCKGMRTDEEVKVEVLNSEEAWQLFVTYTGREATTERIKPLAKAVAKECSGLPLALITVGRAMARKTLKEQWKYALNELQRSEPDIIRDIEKKVYNPLKLSYDSLQGKNVKPCFLYCSLFPEDRSIEVNELVQCWKAEGLMDEQQNFEDSRNRGISIIQILKDSCLLEGGGNENTVKMHDVVRDVAIWIASSEEEGCKFVVQSGKGLSQISDVELLKPAKRISFMDNYITTLPDYVECPKTSTLLLQRNYWLNEVPERFLQGFPVLRVLNMSQTDIQSLPLSLAELGELRALILEGCRNLKKLPLLGGLKKLQLLNLSRTGIKKLPKGMEELSNLSQLLLRDTEDLKRIEAGVLSKLSGLEVLDMDESSYMWGVIGDEEGQATFEELGCLKRLIVVHVNLHSLPYQDLHWIQRLRSFQISVGVIAHTSPQLDERKVILKSLNLWEKRIGWLLNNATHLTLDSCKEIGWLFENIVPNTQGLAGLKNLTIRECDSSLGSFREYAPHDMLPNLEKLDIRSCGEVEGVVALLGLKFSRLRIIDVYDCPNLKYLIPAGLIPNLINLEEIKIWRCYNLEKLFEYDNHTSSGQMVAADPLLPKLRSVRLFSLPELRSICRENESWQSLEALVVLACNQLKRIPLTTQNANTIKRIGGLQQWWDDLEWEDDDTKRTLQPYFKHC